MKLPTLIILAALTLFSGVEARRSNVMRALKKDKEGTKKPKKTKSPKTPKVGKNCREIEYTAYGSVISLPMAWEMEESAIGENLVLSMEITEHNMPIEPLGGVVTATVVGQDMDTFVVLDSNSTFPLSLDMAYSLSMEFEGGSSWVAQGMVHLVNEEIPGAGYVPSVDVSGAIVGGTGALTGAYGEANSDCDFFENAGYCTYTGIVCLPK